MKKAIRTIRFGVAVALCALLTGCGTFFNNQIKNEVQKETEIANECRQVPTSSKEEAQKYQNALTDLTKKALNVTFVAAPGTAAQDSAPDAKSIEEVVADFKKDWTAIYNAATPTTKKAMSAVKADIDGIEAEVKTMGAGIEQTAQKSFGNKKLSIQTVSAAAGDFASVVAQILKQVSPQLKTLEADLNKTGGDLQAMLQDIKRDTNLQSGDPLAAMQAIQADLTALQAAIGAIAGEVDFAMSGSFKFGLMNIDFDTDIKPILADYATYELGTLMSNEITRGSVRLQHGLDQLNQQTLDAIYVVELVLSSTVEQSAAEWMGDWLKTHAKDHNPLENTLLQDFPVNLSDIVLEVACQTINANAQNQSEALLVASKTIDTVLETLILAYVDYNTHDTSNISKAGDVQKVKDAVDNAKPGQRIASMRMALANAPSNTPSCPDPGNADAVKAYLVRPPLDPMQRKVCKDQLAAAALDTIADKGIRNSIRNLQSSESAQSTRDLIFQPLDIAGLRKPAPRSPGIVSYGAAKAQALCVAQARAIAEKPSDPKVVDAVGQCLHRDVFRLDPLATLPQR